MKTNFKKTSILVALLALSMIIIAACQPKAPAEPTPDANMIFTQAAETVAAQLTRTALSIPTNTATPTSEPTATPEPTEDQVIPTMEVVTNTPDVLPTSTLASNPNKMEFLGDVTIPDGTVIAPGAKFVKTWKVKNIGTTTWSANYKVRFWAGDRMGAPTSVLLGKEVKPNEEIDISVEFTAPNTQGEYTSLWILSDEDEANFGVTFYVKIVVGNPATATPTVTATSAPATETPTEEPTATP